MANNLNYTINYMTPFCRYQDPSIGTNLMPIIGIASLVRNIILAAPFVWSFNRNNLTWAAQTSAGKQDYVQSISDFGFLETATVNDGTTSWEFKDVYNNKPLGSSTTQARPSAISVFNDDGQGNITFRLSAVPDKGYTINTVYQKVPVQFAALTDLWSPIPDDFSDVYNNLSMGYYMDSCQDPRAPQYIGRGIAGLLSRSEGLTSTDKAIFASGYMNFNSQMMLEQLRTQQGSQAQGQR